jgi:hypothetical protein
MKNKLFTYWDYDPIQCRPRLELTALGVALAVIAGLITAAVAVPVIYALLVGFAVL